MMRRAIFVLSQKGGPGKSTFARALLDILRYDKRMNVGAFDADGNVGQLLQYYGERDVNGKLVHDQDPVRGVFPFDIRESVAQDNLINALDLDADALLFDLPGGSVGGLTNAIKTDIGVEALIQEYRKAGFNITIVIVMSVVLASAGNVIKTINLFGHDVDYVAVKNLFFGQPEDFLFFEGFNDAHGRRVGGRGKDLILQHRGGVICMPQLRSREYALLDMYNLGFTEALHSPLLRRAERSNVFYFCEGFKTALSTVESSLGMHGVYQ